MTEKNEREFLDMEQLTAAIGKVALSRGAGGKVALHAPSFEGNEWQYVKECLDTGWVSSVGKYVDEFEHRLADYVGVKRAIAVANGTAALHMCLLLAGVKPEDEVIAPALTFIATVNAIAYCGAVPHFADSEYASLGMDAVKLRNYLEDMAEIRGGQCYNRKTGRRIRAVVPMHTFGHPVDLDQFVQVCNDFCLVLVEDAAESIGSTYKGRHTGQWGKLAAMSFNGNKIVTTGGGGAILTNDEELGAFAKHITTQAKVPHAWEFSHDHIGYNYRMPNINAALGCAQLEKLPDFVARKRMLTKRYAAALGEVKGVRLQIEPAYASSNYWLQAILLEPEWAGRRDEVLQRLNHAGIQSRPIWNLMYTMPMFAGCPRMDCTVAEDIGRRLVNIPSGMTV